MSLKRFQVVSCTPTVYDTRFALNYLKVQLHRPTTTTSTTSVAADTQWSQKAVRQQANAGANVLFLLFDHFNAQSFFCFFKKKPNKLDFFRRRHTLVKIICKRSSSSSSSCAVISDCRCQTSPARRVRIQLHLISGTRWLGYSEKLGHLKFGPKAKSLDKVGKVGLKFCQELYKPLNN